MRKLHIILFLTFAALWSCGGGADSKVASSGAPYDVFVVCDDEGWNGPLSDTLRGIFSRPVEMLSQYEPSFGLSRVGPQDFSKLISRHHNILYIKTGAEYSVASIEVGYDVDAAPQIVVRATAPTAAALAGYVSGRSDFLTEIFEKAERDRNLAAARRHNEKALMRLMAEKFGMRIDIPKGYKLRAQGDDFVWISRELPLASQGFFIYSYPAVGLLDFEPEGLVARRDEFAARIPGPSEGSFMTTYAADAGLYPRESNLNIDGRDWVKMSGFWDVEGDFMGGPFVSYSTLASGRVVTLDCYLFSPKQPKRNFLRQLEHLVYSAVFSADN